MQTTLYKNELAKQEILSLYQKKLDTLNIDFEIEQIETSFGNTNCIIYGDRNKEPFVILHGANGNATIGLEPLIKLSEWYCLYSIDVIGQPNYSSESRPNMKTDEYSRWLDDVLSGLQINNAIIYGMSFGGFIVNKAIVNNTDRIKEVFLHVPAGVVNGNPFIGIFRALIPMKKYMKTQDKKYLNVFLDQTFSEKDDFAINFLSKVLLNMKMDFTPVPTLKRRDMKKILCNVHVIGAENDIFFPGKKIIKRLNKYLPKIGYSYLIEKGRHVPSKKENDEILNFVKKVLKIE